MRRRSAAGHPAVSPPDHDSSTYNLRISGPLLSPGVVRSFAPRP